MDYQYDSESLFNIISAYVDYLLESLEKNPAEDEKLRAIQLEIMRPNYEIIRDLAKKAFEEGKTGKLKRMFKDLFQDAWEDVLLEEYVFERTGIRLGMADKMKEKLREIVARGQIKNENEYYLVMERIDVLAQLGARDEALIDNLNQIVTKFESKFA